MNAFRSGDRHASINQNNRRDVIMYIHGIERNACKNITIKYPDYDGRISLLYIIPFNNILYIGRIDLCF